MTTHLLVGNPTAQSGMNKERIELALAELEKRGIRAELLHTLPAGATIGAVTRALDAGSHAVVIAMGGDGTFREVAAGLVASRRTDDVALGMLPTGTANDQGKSFGLEATREAIARNVAVIADAHETRLDAGRIRAGEAKGSAERDDYFFDSAGWGLSARVLAQRNADRQAVATMGPLKELYRDHAVYAGAFLKTFLESYVTDDKFVAHATLDGETQVIEGLTDLVVKNTRVYAGAWVLDRTSRHDDGAFELVPFRGKRDWASKAMLDLEGNPLTDEMVAELGLEHSRPLRASRIELELVPGPMHADVPAQIDGEEWVSHPYVSIEVLPRAIRLIVPAP